MTTNQIDALIAAVWVIATALAFIALLTFMRIYVGKIEKIDLEEKNTDLEEQLEKQKDKNNYLERRLLWHEAKDTFQCKDNKDN